MRVLVLSLLAAAAPLGPALAVEPLEGWFIAEKACEAFQSKNKGTNPGEVMTEPLRAYAMIALNAPGGDFFQVKVPGAPVTEDRWVHVSCGLHVVEAGTPTAPLPDEPVEPAPGEESVSNLLALSWQPAFCELKPGKTECEQLNAGELPITETQLSLHGLWPQPRGQEYCGVPAGLVALDKASRWAELPEVAVDAETASSSRWRCRGRRASSSGTSGSSTAPASSAPAGRTSISTTRCGWSRRSTPRRWRRSSPRTWAASSSTADLRAAFDAAFGAGAGERVQVHCAGDRGRTLIQEVSVNLAGAIGPETPVAALILAADPVSPAARAGVVDPAGLQ